MRHFDIVIIGSGSGNTMPDQRFADRSVAVVEEGVFGGTCLNVGCIPTKMFVYTAHVARCAREASRFGVDATVDKVRWADIRDRVFGRIDPISAGGKQYRATGEPNITLFTGHGAFTGHGRLAVTDALGAVEEITGDRFVIATGSRAMVPAEFTDSGVPFHTSDTVMRLGDLPRRLVVVGGGYIAAELANVFGSLGSEVTVVSRGSGMLRHLDRTISERFTELARAQWDLRTGVLTESVDATPDGTRLRLSDGGEVIADEILVATGRIPNSDRLNLDAVGVRTHDDGRIVVDEYQRTGADGIYALGDVSSPYQLKHVANHEARVTAHNLLHPDAPRRTDHRFVPAAVFTDPEIASVGLTEAQCRERGQRYVTKIQDYGGVAFGWAMEDTTGFCKVLADPATGTLLGAHLMGPDASSLIQPLIQAMSFGLGAREMATGQYWIHPALPEVLENALLGLPLD